MVTYHWFDLSETLDLECFSKITNKENTALMNKQINKHIHSLIFHFFHNLKYFKHVCAIFKFLHGPYTPPLEE